MGGDLTSFAYIHCKPDGSPFYVGKGTEHRSNSFIARNSWYANIVKKYGKENILVAKMECSTDAVAFELELGIIRCLRRQQVNLCNLNDGGEGFESGNKAWNKGTKGVMKAWNKGLKASEETRKKISEVVKKQMQDPSHRAKLSEIKKGKPSNMAGKNHSDEAKAKMSASKKGVPSGKLGMKISEQARENVRKAARVQWTCPHCNTIGMNIGAANRWHFNNCKEVA